MNKIIAFGFSFVFIMVLALLVHSSSYMNYWTEFVKPTDTPNKEYLMWLSRKSYLEGEQPIMLERLSTNLHAAQVQVVGRRFLYEGSTCRVSCSCGLKIIVNGVHEANELAKTHVFKLHGGNF